jgi:4-hydroxy-tetrahydrodipicolinate synthase
MVMCPAYNKPNQRGLYNHFKEINDSVSIPIMIYNSPSRTGVNISDETISSLSMLRNIKAVKDSTGDLQRPITLRDMLKEGSDFKLLGADDILALSFNANGGEGCVSVASNIIPSQIKNIQDLTLSGDFKSAYEIHKTLVPIYLSMFCETNPVPVKYAAFIAGKISSPEVRSPMMELTQESKLMIENALKDLT